jgi:hypothetical protein
MILQFELLISWEDYFSKSILKGSCFLLSLFRYNHLPIHLYHNQTCLNFPLLYWKLKISRLFWKNWYLRQSYYEKYSNFSLYYWFSSTTLITQSHNLWFSFIKYSGSQASFLNFDKSQIIAPYSDYSNLYFQD